MDSPGKTVLRTPRARYQLQLATARPTTSNSTRSELLPLYFLLIILYDVCKYPHPHEPSRPLTGREGRQSSHRHHDPRGHSLPCYVARRTGRIELEPDSPCEH